MRQVLTLKNTDRSSIGLHTLRYSIIGNAPASEAAEKSNIGSSPIISAQKQIVYETRIY
jgi:hypothetical protein